MRGGTGAEMGGGPNSEAKRPAMQDRCCSGCATNLGGEFPVGVSWNRGGGRDQGEQELNQCTTKWQGH